MVKEAANPPPPPVLLPVVQAVPCAECGGTLHAEGNYPNLFRCGDCDKVQKLVPGPRLSPPAPEPVREPTETEVREAEHVRQPSPDFPRKLSSRVAYQMRGRGFTVVDGWPIAGGRGTFSTPDETWKYDDDGDWWVSCGNTSPGRNSETRCTQSLSTSRLYGRVTVARTRRCSPYTMAGLTT